MSRASTMLLALLVMNVLLGVLSLVVARGERRSAALRLWGWGLLVYAIGLLITIPPAIPLTLRKVTGNGLIALAPVLTVAGLLRHTSVRLSRLWVGIGFAATVAAIAINHARSDYSVLFDMLAPAALANALYIVAAVALMRHPPADARNAARFLAGILAFCVLVWTVRIVLISVSLGGTNDRDRADLTIALFAIAQMVIAVAATLGLFWVEVRNMQAALQSLANTDALTALPNRRATLARFDEEVARAARHGRPFSLVLFDVDRFKHINDSRGHAAGDEILRRVAAALASAARETDTVGRIGGEEFVVILGEEGLSGAEVAANRLREHVSEHAGVTVSGGLAAYPSEGTSWDALFTLADHRLYEAKNGGRNRVIAGNASDVVAIRATS